MGDETCPKMKFKGTVIQIEKGLINDPLRILKEP